MAKRNRKGADDGAVSELFEPYVWSWFAEAFAAPSPPQSAAWPAIARGTNTLIFSPTGSGKTLAAFLWCINDLYKLAAAGEMDDAVHVLYVSPLKALNNDIQKNLVAPLRGIARRARRAGVSAEVRCEVRTGDTPAAKRAAMARRPPQILITTPESLFIILSTQKSRLGFRSVRYVIVDEIHALSDNKRGVHLSLSLERLAVLAGRDFVRIGLSATQKPLEEIAAFLVGREQDGRPRPCEIVDVGARKDLNVRVIAPVDNLLEAQFDAIWGSAYEKMISMVRRHRTTLIFANSRYKTERTALRLNELAGEEGVRVGAHHGSMSKAVRLDMENRLKAGRLDALVATSSLELGIDVGSIDLVCQIESPKSVSRGLQRIGRAGHLLDATSEGRLLVTDRDDLVESAVLVRAILDGAIDTTRVPTNCLDVLAQHVVGAVAADEWDADELFALCRQSHCCRELPREDYDRVLEMLSGGYTYDMDRPPYPRILWDKVNDVLSPERGARMIAFRASGTIPDVSDYDVYFEARGTKVGQLGEGFVEQLRTGDIFILGSSSWRVLGIRRNRVLVEDVYGRAPTIPYWHGEHESRTFDLGRLVGRFRREMKAQMARGSPLAWLRREYHVDEDGARSILEYFREQQLLTGDVPSDRLVMIEHFDDELGRRQIVLHSSFGLRVNNTWALALARAIADERGFVVQTAAVDDGILITAGKGRRLAARSLAKLVTPRNVDALVERAVVQSPVFASRFRHNAVRALLVLRHDRGRRTPVWLQSLRASALLEAVRDDREFPVTAETLRECLHEALDLAGLKAVLRGLVDGRIKTKTLASRIPSPFTHSLLLLGQYGEMGSIPPRERRSRLMHLHRELLRQILDEQTLRDLLDEEAVAEVEARLQRTHPRRRARTANELARTLVELGDLVDGADEQLSLGDRADGDARRMLAGLVSRRRAVLAPIPTAETSGERWIATENFPLYRAAFAAPARLAEADRKLLRALAAKGPCPLSALGKVSAGLQRRVERLLAAYEVVRITENGRARYAAAQAWVPKKILARRMSRREARLELVRKFLRWHGPTTPYEIMERYGFAASFVEAALAELREAGGVARGEYVPTKSFPQWCHKANLEEIHRRTLNRLRREMEPATAAEYSDFLLRWQHVHPAARLSGIGGLREAIAQLGGHENFQALFERDIFPSRVTDYDGPMLDRLGYGGEACWRRFGWRDVKRGQIGFCLRADRDWLVADPAEIESLGAAGGDEDIRGAIDAVRELLAQRGECFFEAVVDAAGGDRRIALRAIWRLVWNGEAASDGYESIRHAAVTSGLSACYDLSTDLGRTEADNDAIGKRMLEYRRLDPTLGKWRPTERLSRKGYRPPSGEERAAAWARLLLRRWGVVCRDTPRRQIGAPPWRDLRRALAKLELLGEVRRGLFVRDLAGEQYAWPQAVDALRDAKLRAPPAPGTAEGASAATKQEGGPERDSLQSSPAAADEPMILLNSCDPANLFCGPFRVTDEIGRRVKFPRNPHNYLVLQFGRPLLVYQQGRVTVLTDLTKARAERALRALLGLVDRLPRTAAYKEIAVRDWNGHPSDVSPARHLLAKLGFVPASARRKGLVYDGAAAVDAKTRARADRDMPELFEHARKEQAPVRYDADWIVSRSPQAVRPTVRELLAVLERVLPEGCELTFGPRNFNVRYRGVACLNPSIQQKRIRIGLGYQGIDAWCHGMLVEAGADVAAPAFVDKLLAGLGKTRAGIDSHLDGKRCPGRTKQG